VWPISAIALMAVPERDDLSCGPMSHDAATQDDFRPNADELVANNSVYADGFGDEHLPVQPRRRLAVVACMDSRMDIFQMLGLQHGEAHVIRNAGGVITDDVIRSLCLSQRYLQTREIVLVHHTDCGLQLVTEDQLKSELEAELGVKPWWSVEAFSDPYADTRQSMERLRLTPFIPHKDDVRGFVYDVDTGRLNEVE
jgi:carbonic anhydrase